MVTNGLDIAIKPSSAETQAEITAPEIKPMDLAKAAEKESNVTELEKPDSSKTKTIDELVKELNTDAIYREIPPEELKKIQEKASDLFMQYTNRGMEFEKDEETGKMIVRLIDKSSGEVVRQIPPQQFLELAAVFAKAASMMNKDVPKFI